MKLTLLLTSFLLTICANAAAPRPNIILIMGDDMGISDLGCYGSEIDTPNLNRLANDGLRFTQFYNTARCCPTRASLLTGLYPHQAGIGHMMNDNGHDGYRGELNRNCLTIAEALKTVGYGTYMAGKWHLTKSTASDGPKDNWPKQRGFDRFYGTIHGAGSLWDPNSLTRDNTQLAPDNDPEYSPEKTWFYTDAIADQTSRYIKEHTTQHPDKPFFSYVSFTAAHWPMHAREETIAKYKGKYGTGFKAIRETRFEKMKSLGIISPNTILSDQAQDWEKNPNKEWDTRCMEVYAAMIDEMDQAIGKIIATVETAGQLENTLIFFLQDNGGCAENFGRGKNQTTGSRAGKPTLPPMAKGELQMHMQPKQTRDGYPVRTGPGVMPGPADTYIAYGQGWANVSNTPFREYKHWVHEGGISTPLIAYWPAGIKRTGQLEHQPSHLIDIMATCVELAGVNYPTQLNNHTITPLEGHSLNNTFNGQPIQRDALFWEHEGNCAIRKGDWKLVRKENQPWELYNIATDRTERNNQAQQHPSLVTSLSQEFQAYADRAQVSPIGTWRGNAKKNKAQTKPNPNSKPNAKTGPLTPINDKPGLPRVLIIGDSISIGYTLPVRQLLKDKANVHRPQTNCASTNHGLKSLDSWLGEKPWDVIHFNWGLHDLKYVSPGTENLADHNDPKNRQQVSIEDYEKNLTELVARLKKTNAKLIWRSTTPIPTGSKGRIPGDSEKYNAVARKIMEANNIPIDDLFSLAKPIMDEIGKKADVHYTPAGYNRLAQQVADSILHQLEK